jgi:hypothetical protein
MSRAPLAHVNRGLRVAVFAAFVCGIAPALAVANNSRRTPTRESHRATRRPVHHTSVVGIVVDRDGNRVPGASVIAVRSGADAESHGAWSGGSGSAVAGPVSAAECQPKTVVTDSFGQFELDGLAPGDYWFIGIHGDHPFGMTPALPVRDRLEVAITLDLAVLSA